ncbi:hypothetical protein IAT38_004108 [Cryptococcus sp. DSM 104549]
MAKKTAPVPSAASASKSSKPKATPAATSSSIDDIFAAPKAKKSKLEAPVVGPSKSEAKPSKKEKSKPAAPAEAPGSGAQAVGEKKKKKKKVKSVAAFIPEDDASEPASKVETVVDPSTIPAAIPAPPAAAKSKKEKGKSLKRDRNEVDDDEIFRDSRGTGPRRQTEEGFLIFKEAELKIDPEAGGTPLCPFDCDCCF